MAGKNQHYIPRMLLRGFSRPSQSGKEQQAYVYRHNQIFLDNINRIASENYFYSSQSDGTTPILDDKITAYESERIQSRFRVLQNANFDDRVDAEIATEIFTHFCIRQKFQQSIWSDTFSLIGYIVAYSALKSPEYVSKKAGIKKVFGVSYLSPKSDLWRSIIENAKQQNFLMFMLSYPITFFFAPYFLKKICEEKTMEEVISHLAGFRLDMEKVTTDAFRTHLHQTLESPFEARPYKEWIWQVRRAPAGGLVLPDCVGICLNEGYEFMPIGLLERDTFNKRIVIMPIDSERVLVGINGIVLFPETLDINHALVACSHSFFVARERTPAFERLTNEIRSRYTKGLTDMLTSSFGKTDQKAV